MLQRLYRFLLDAAGRPSAPYWLALVAFLESSVFPVPPDVLLAPMALARPQRALMFAAICTAASIAGAWLGYAIGFLLFESIGAAILDFYHYGPQFADFQAKFRDYGVWIILIKGLTPIPFKLVTLAAGVAKMDLLAFTLAAIVTRGARFFLLAALLKHFGAPIQAVLDRYLAWVFFGVLALLVLGFAALRWL